MKIIKVNNCRECQYKDTYINTHGQLNSNDYFDSYKYCKLKYIKTGEIRKIENLDVIVKWCDLGDYNEKDKSID